MYEEYVKWKKKEIERILSNQIYEFDYSVEKNYEQIKLFLGLENIEISILKRYEEKLEIEEKEYIVKTKEGEIKFEKYLENIKEKIKKEYAELRDDFLNYVKSDDNFKELELQEGTIASMLFDYEVSKENLEIKDVYGFPANYKYTYYFVDEGNKKIINTRKIS